MPKAVAIYVFWPKWVFQCTKQSKAAVSDSQARITVRKDQGRWTKFVKNAMMKVMKDV